VTLPDAPQVPVDEVALVYDGARARVVMASSENITFSTWELDAGAWSPRRTTIVLPVAFSAGYAFDALRGRVVRFGGDSDGSGSGDTWKLDAEGWRQGAPEPSPDARTSMAMAFDTARGQTLMVGGFSGATSLLSETWLLGAQAREGGEVRTSQLDHDGDGASSCLDDECWGVCTPLCPPDAPAATCPDAPACGDGMCSAPLEDCRICPADCPTGTAACPILCGDGTCDASTESAASCPGDCSMS